ncbi:alanine--tRNA ligase [Thiotrichales bacterium 19S9-12]|nr:alanine--tRNA ligase [Thiotrichales bacterium 19S9-11]MCF6812446.1 alanine--tRNA ligase [Thiotrichales bacterium 19S9-12]
MKVNDIRKQFIDYFVNQGHKEVESSPLVPNNDDTLLFTNAGMVQFKDVFLGQDKRSYKKAVTSQRCVRAGGKHNDLENVGYTARHHTFFEMLGNFSFGDYFKKEAIQFAWEFLTEVVKLPKDKLWVTVYIEDDEAADIWLNDIGVSPNQFSRIGAKDNFWSMGETGPCGPCTEIFYDHGEDVAGGPPGTENDHLDRYIEIWNLVFMQYNRLPDGTLEDLPNPSVDTGMGIERLAAVLQGVHNNYEIDLFQYIIDSIASILNINDKTLPSLKVIADHIRACSFLIADGVMPSNEGRGYVLRRIIRRAVRHGHKLGAKDIFFYQIVQALVDQMGDAYPILKTKQKEIESILKKEETQFQKTLNSGMKLLEEALTNLDGDKLSGDTAFMLYDTYGFPLDLTQDILREKDLSVDIEGFDQLMGQQRARAKKSSSFKQDYSQRLEITGESEFTGYAQTVSDAEVLFVLDENFNQAQQIETGQQGILILSQTPFYAESGGQAGDQGMIESIGAQFEVKDTQKSGDLILHHGVVKTGTFNISQEVTALVNKDRRIDIALNHSATHLLHAALKKVLGDHVQQKGSLVLPGRLRFDFSHHQPVKRAELDQVEALVNREIRHNHPVETIVTSFEHANQLGAVALFGEKYADEVRVLSMGDFSMELCGGTHVQRTGDIGYFSILSETGIASGVRRIEAMTGRYAEQKIKEDQLKLSQVMHELKAKPETIVEKLSKLKQQVKQLEKENAQLKLSEGKSVDLKSEIETVGDINLISTEIKGGDMALLRHKIDQLKSQMQRAIIVLAAVKDEKVQLCVGVTKDLTDEFSAGEIINFVAQQVGGKGGGRRDMAQAGGKNPENLNQALKSVRNEIYNMLPNHLEK